MSLEEIFMRVYRQQEWKHGVDAVREVNRLTNRELVTALSDALEELLAERKESP